MVKLPGNMRWVPLQPDLKHGEAFRFRWASISGHDYFGANIRERFRTKAFADFQIYVGSAGCSAVGSVRCSFTGECDDEALPERLCTRKKSDVPAGSASAGVSHTLAARQNPGSLSQRPKRPPAGRSQRQSEVCLAPVFTSCACRSSFSSAWSSQKFLSS